MTEEKQQREQPTRTRAQVEYDVICEIREQASFIQGVVAALDVVAASGQEVLFNEIVDVAGREDTLKEIRKNGSVKAKALAARRPRTE